MEQDRITIDPIEDAWCSLHRSLRIPVVTVMGQLAAGDSRTAGELLANFPDLEANDIIREAPTGWVCVVGPKPDVHARHRHDRRCGRQDDGRSARFVIAFAVGTIEDPALGAHAGFLDEVAPVAEAVDTFAIDPDSHSR